MKTTHTISMAEFLTEVGKLAKQVNQGYYTANCEIQHTRPDKVQYEFTCYIHTLTHLSGSTPNESLEKMKTLINGRKPSKIKEILIEDCHGA